ncbi:MAG: pectate lyase [Massilia sp.]|jgi:hypothetical protein|nr:pectate lyase [Massilia sp.]
MDSADHAFNSWNLAAPVTDADFDSVAAAGWDAPRQADGSLPFLPALRLAPQSRLVGPLQLISRARPLLFGGGQ